MVLHLARENASNFYGSRFFAAGDGVSLGDLLGRFSAAALLNVGFFELLALVGDLDERFSVSLDLDYGIVGEIQSRVLKGRRLMDQSY